MKTFILLKNDCIQRGLVGAVLARIEACNLHVASIWTVTPTKALLEKHYAELGKKNHSAFARTVDFMTGKMVFAAIIEGPNAVAKVRQVVGATFPLNAAPGTIRADFGNDTVEAADKESRTVMNVIHASDSPENADAEIKVWQK